MFRDTFGAMFGISCETKLLEACSWDEDRAAEVSTIFCNELSQLSEDSIVGTPDKIFDNLKESLLLLLNDYEVEVLMEILSDCSENFYLLLSESEEYEN